MGYVGDHPYAIELVDVNGMLGSYLAHWRLPIVPRPGDQIGIYERGRWRVIDVTWRQERHSPATRYPFVTVTVHCEEVK